MMPARLRFVRARGFLARAIGWLGREKAPRDIALWLEPCCAVHTFGMRFAIDIAFVDQMDRILRIDAAVPPWRIRWCSKAKAVVELASGACLERRLFVGCRLDATSARCAATENM